MTNQEELMRLCSKMPLLNEFGIGVYDNKASREDQEAALIKGRERLLEAHDRVLAIRQWLAAHIEPIRTLNRMATSYSFKHAAEKELGYITNGQFIAAAILEKYCFRVVEGGPNAIFGMSKASWAEVRKRQNIKGF